jgi:hypothetical protein
MYARTLRDELDAFIGEELTASHSVGVASDVETGIVEVRLIRNAPAPQPIRVANAKATIDHELALARAHLSAADSQWAYFRRDLRIYAGSRTYFFKPFERLHWTRTQAILDAAELLAEMVTVETEPEPTRA